MPEVQKRKFINTKNINRIVFPNLNGLRFIAALSVIIMHVEFIKAGMSLNNVYSNPIILSLGQLGVSLFFVLSGFLITYLLLAEQDIYGSISVKKFYSRRILRIWPLYYLIVTLGLFVLPSFHFFDIPHGPVSEGPDGSYCTEFLKYHFYIKALFFYLIFPNIPFVGFPKIPYVSQTWSIGVEEQFYIIWPLFIKYFKNYIEILIFIITGLTILRNTSPGIILYQINKVFHFSSPGSRLLFRLNRSINEFLLFFRIDCMAIGGIGAYLLFHKKNEFLAVIFKRSFQVCTYLFLSFLLLGAIPLSQSFYSLFFIVIILNLAGNKDTILNLENPVMNYLGKISYGIYMYHFLAITLAIKSVQLYDKAVNGLFSGVLLYFLALVYTIGLSSASYHLFENQFIKLKKTFERVKSLQ